MKNSYVSERISLREKKYRHKNKIKSILSFLDNICLDLIDENCEEGEYELIKKVLTEMEKGNGVGLEVNEEGRN